ncbi:GIY-YIG nuclease family protein [Alteromonas sp. ASW11-130]|uniref:GIY-YIG nuclease family protein n=1 Tax=Alteromonas sp. ASW11-130 TaxID=3015775 RepID=UPI002241D43E|nr:GIY-YIG nuclease family protein [Alteromonas sp. ASW11-130]MCW8091335.1 GIY-YIG nuclease family protein [Alteromonas sp. ASW11-130]
MSKPYTIRLFVPSGNPSSLKIIDKMNWTGKGIEVSRDAWTTYRNRKEFLQTGIYILIGYEQSDDIPTVYVGQGDGVKSRIESHYSKKPFWDKAIVFISSNDGLNRGHITWIEWALISKAIAAGRCVLDNSVVPSEPALTESEKSDTREFLNELLSILPLIHVQVFNKPEKIDVYDKESSLHFNIQDTIIVPAQDEGFQKVFLGENCWYAVRISGGKLKDIKYIAAYQTAPVSEVTHVAEVESIEPYGDGGKYKINFKGSAQVLKPIVYGSAKTGAMQSTRYTTYEKLVNANELNDLF